MDVLVEASQMDHLIKPANFNALQRKPLIHVIDDRGPSIPENIERFHADPGRSSRQQHRNNTGQKDAIEGPGPPDGCHWCVQLLDLV